MSTKREIIDSLRMKLRELNADSTFSNKFLYQTILEQASWLIRREAAAGRIWISNALFQNIPVRMIEVPLIDSCLPIKSGCKIFRSEVKVWDVWMDAYGPLIKSVSSVDGSTDFFYTTSMTWVSKKKDPYKKKTSQKFFFFEDGYIWIPEHNPHFVTMSAFFMDDTSLLKQDCLDCDKDKDCVKFLDTKLMIPHWIEAELLSKALELLVGVTKRMPEDEQINKNPNTKG